MSMPTSVPDWTAAQTAGRRSRPSVQAARIGLALCLAGLAAATSAHESLDHDHIWQLRESGAILPMAEVLARVGAMVAGDLLEAELEHTPTGYRYKLELLLPAGLVETLYLDAVTGAVLQRATVSP